jgi:5-formyltetrahydrofolate cyclo-ligase
MYRSSLSLFDSAGYRLGHGGRYFDRTFAPASKRPRIIGRPIEAHNDLPAASDIPLDIIVTEKEIAEFKR